MGSGSGNSVRRWSPNEEKVHVVDDFSPKTRATRALIVEDNPDLATTLTVALATVHCHSTCAANGEIAIKTLLDNDYDVIICDMSMPAMAGDMFYLAAERARPKYRRRFIFMTGHHGEKKWDDFAREKGCLILWKPFQMQTFLEAVGIILRQVREGAR